MKINISQYINGTLQNYGFLFLENVEKEDILKNLKIVINQAEDDVSFEIYNNKNEYIKNVHTKKSFGPIILSLE